MVTFGILVDIQSEMKCSFSHGVKLRCSSQWLAA